jgi:pyruvate dehydrogenase E2 component (dihydrolipoamide acetyltransferase)
MASSGGRAAALIARRAAALAASSSTSTSTSSAACSASSASWLSSSSRFSAAAMASTSYSSVSSVASLRSFSVAAAAATTTTSSSSLLVGPLRHQQRKQPHSSRFFSSLPPHTSLDMPALSPTMTTGNIASWKKAEGDAIAAGDIIAEIETDKATMEWEAQDEGVLAKIVVQAGARDVPVGTPVAIVVDEASDVAAFANYEAGSAATSSSSSNAAAAAPAAPASSSPPSSSLSNFPPHTLMGLPALSPTMAAGNIASWKKKAGDSVSAGDVLAEVETDKATMEWEAQDDGVIAKILVEAGVSDVPVGTPVAVVVDDEGLVGAFAGYTAADAAAKEGGSAAAAAAPAAAAAVAAAPVSAPSSVSSAPRATATLAAGPRVIASPYAKKLAADAGVSLVGVPGTGPAGRVVAADVAALLASGGGAKVSSASPTSSSAAVEIGTEYETFSDVPHSQIRRVTASRLLQSKQQVPHYYLTVDVRLDALLETRARLNEARAAMGKKGDEGPAKLSVNDFVLKAAALALKAVPGVNAAWSADFTRVFKNVDINVAVQAPSGLMVPLLIDADKAGLGEISAKVRALAAAARDGNLKPEQMASGTFTVSNLGMFGVEQFAAIVNPPQAAILAVGGARPVLVPSKSSGDANEDGGPGFEAATVLSATLSCDHRVVDGAMGAQWLQAFKRFMEQPLTMLL